MYQDKEELAMSGTLSSLDDVDTSDADPALLKLLRKDFALYADRPGAPLASAMTGEVPEEYEPLVRQAVEAGWSQEQALATITQLAREFEGARGTRFD
jgi:hypothetical protein